MAPEPAERPIALITGAARRLGRAIALDLAVNGWSIAIHYRSGKADAEALAAEIRQIGGTAVMLAADLADPLAVAQLVPRCVADIGTPVCLINNASIFEFDTVATMQPETLARHLAVNLQAPVALAQAFACALPADGHGNIINIIDQRVWASTPEFFSYSLSKSALWSATRMLAQGLSPRIRVNAIGPGPTLPNVHQKPEDFAAEAAATLLERATSPREVASAVRFILDAPAMTGQMIALDSGQHLRWFAEAAPLAAGHKGAAT
jgi:NAD(P)-dependent dehydrogenase (short-subunit alcohol dehydrogenase family)